MTGSVVKFPPAGGCFWQASNKEAKQAKPEGPGIKLVEAGWHATSEVFASGALLAFPGTAPTSVYGSCACRTPRFDLDDYGRLYLPDAVTFRVRVYDAAGNVIRTIGSYGNFDSQYVPPDSKDKKPLVAVPEIPFGCPLSVGCAERNMYVSDMTNHRVVCVDLSCAAEETVEIK
jgi:hypothetical protein